MITLEQCEARIWKDSELMSQALSDNDFAGWLVSSIGPMDDDPVARNERIHGYIEASVEAYAEWMAREENAEQAEQEADAAHESRLMDRDNAADINRMNGSYR